MATYTIYLEQEFILTQTSNNWTAARGTPNPPSTGLSYTANGVNGLVGTYNDGTTYNSHQMHLLANTSAVPAGVDSNFIFSIHNIDPIDTGHSIEVRVNAWPSASTSSWVAGDSITSKTPLMGTLTTANTTTGRSNTSFSYTSVPRSSTFKFSMFDAYAKANTAPPSSPAGQYLQFYESSQNAGTTFDPYIQFDSTPPDTTPPTITSSAFRSVNENSLLSHALTANESVTWAIRTTAQNAASTDATRFEISGTTLRWLSNGTKDYENPNDSNLDNIYKVVVRATDTAGNFTDQTISVTVDNLDEVAPTITSASTKSVNENSTLSHVLTANESVTWSIRSTIQNATSVDASRFELSGATLRWAGNGTKDFEAPNDSNGDNVYQVVVRATDTAGNVTDQTIQVTVTNVDDTAPTITSSATVSVAENAPLAHALTANEAVNWGLYTSAQYAPSLDGSKFEISGSTLRWAGNGTKDYEVPDDSDSNNVYRVVVWAQDLAGNVSLQTIDVTVTDVAESWGITAASATQARTTTSPSLSTTNFVTAQDTTRGHASTSPSLSAKSTVVPDNASQARDATSPTVTTKNTVTVDSVSQARSTTTPSLAAKSLVTVQSSSHAHDATSPSLSAKSVVTVQDAFQARVFTTPTLLAKSFVTAQSASQARTTTTASLTAKSFVTVQDASQARTTTQPTPTAKSTVVPDNALQARTTTSPTAAAKSIVTVQDASQTRTTTSPTASITQAGVDSAFQSRITTSPSLAAKSFVTAQNASQDRTTTSATLAAKSSVVPANALQSRSTTEPSLAAKSQVIPADAYQARTSTSATVVAQSAVTVHNSSQARSTDQPSISARSSVSVDDAFQARSTTSPSVAIKFNFAPNDAFQARTTTGASLTSRSVVVPNNAFQARLSTSPLVLLALTTPVGRILELQGGVRVVTLEGGSRQVELQGDLREVALAGASRDVTLIGNSREVEMTGGSRTVEI